MVAENAPEISTLPLTVISLAIAELLGDVGGVSDNGPEVGFASITEIYTGIESH